MRVISLSPFDSWFFRDGRPMHLDESSTFAAESMFPPQAPTVVGAIRLALARANGLKPGRRWSESEDMRRVLGAEQDLGELSFVGPFLAKDRVPLFPMPLSILGKGDAQGRWQPSAFLTPGEAVDCDLGQGVRLPGVPEKERQPGLKNGQGLYLTPDGLCAVLRGRLPGADHLVAREELWKGESRIGIKRNPDSRTTEEHALFSTKHIRLAEGVSLLMGVNGLPTGWKMPEGMVPFGGEGRLAEIALFDGLDVPSIPVVADRTMALYLLTPADFGADWPRPGGTVPGLPGARIVSACIEKPLRLGGWCSIKHAPLPVRPLVPAGSVLFMEIESGSEKLAHTAPLSLGERTEYGFGLAVAGLWRDKEGN